LLTAHTSANTHTSLFGVLLGLLKASARGGRQ